MEGREHTEEGGFANNVEAVPSVDSACLEWIKAKLQLLLQEEGAADTDTPTWLDQAWSASAHEQPVAAFLTSVKVSRLLAVKAKADDTSFSIMHELPSQFHLMVYFLKDQDHFITRHNISQLVQFGVLKGSDSTGFTQSTSSSSSSASNNKGGSSSSAAGASNGSSSSAAGASNGSSSSIASSMELLLRLMASVYLPQVAHSGSWPDAVRKDFLSYTHRFMSSLTEAVHEAQGRTVLYMPAEELNSLSTHEAARDRHLTQRLETTLMYWTRQIASVLNKQDCSDMGQRAGPLVEIAFWRSRSLDLNGISAQLEDKQVSDIVKVLTMSGSSYLGPFLQLKERIKQEAVAAEDNVRFLACLEGPCQQLSKATPQQIPALLPQVLNCIRMVWSLSKYYNTPERIVSLLQKLSNEIINRCCSALRVDDIFTGNVLGVMEMLQQSMAAGQQYKVCYDFTAAAIAVSSTRPWDFDAPIFSYMDAFLQRCTDLLEVCEAQLQFAPDAKLPVFGGTRGAEVEKNIADIQAAFKSLLGQLKGLGYDMLDIQAIQWHDDFTAFKAGVHDLEVMLENVMQLALDSTPSLSGMLELLEGFQLMAKRTAVKRAVERHMSEFYRRFMAEINAIKKHFDTLRRMPPASPMLPHYAGAARAANCLLKRLEQCHAAVLAVKHMLPAVPEAADTLMAYDLTHQALQQFIVNTHTEWFNTIDNSIAKSLHNNLLTQDKATGNLLSMNYDRPLLSMTQEVQHWERLRMAVPYIAMEIQAQREKYRVLRDNMLMVVHDYNKVLTALDGEERRLFADRIRVLDRRIMPGVSKLNWVADKHALEFFYKEARKHCHLADNCVTGFKAGLSRIDALCKSIADGLLIDVEKKKLYEISEFEAVQGRHHEMAKQRLLTDFQEIQHTLAEMHTFFESDGEDVQREWVRFTARVDKKVEAVLHYAVKRSLQELNRLLNGDSKTEVLPVFRVALVLERNNAVELKPSLQELFETVGSVCENVMAITEQLPRLALLGTARQLKELEDRGQPQPQPPESYFHVIKNDKEHVINIVVHLVEGLATASAPIQACVEHFEKRYKKLWDQDKDAYIRRYEKANKPLSSYELDIKEYLNKEDEIQREETTANVKFLFVDCGPLKQMLTAHCQLWRSKLTSLLNNLAATELRSLHDHFRSGLEMLAKTPQDLEQLADAVVFHKKLSDDKARIAGRFEPLRDKYRVLERFEVQVPDAQLELLDKLDGEWAKFQVGITEGAARLERSKDVFREKVKAMLEAFLRELATMQEDFARLQPTSKDGVSSTTGLAFIAKWKAMLEAARHKAAEIQSGMDIFSIPQPPYKELTVISGDLELLSKMWGVVAEWEVTYGGWKNGHFKELKVEDMEEAAARLNKQVTKLGRDVKAWAVWSWLKDTIDAFKKTMPLITDLRNPAMRPRHWQQLMEHIKTKFDPNSTRFTLESVVSLHLDQHCDFISELSVTASKEAAIETSLSNISATWAELQLDMAEYKGTHKLRSTEDIFTALEDNGVTLSTMKASKYYLVFEEQVAHWERTLALASETVEMILQVQRNWMYLENIFVGSEDIRKQLPQESLMFDGVNLVFMRSMAQLHAVSNVIQATNAPGVLATFQDMDTKLEKVQKSLDNYLESKRQQFPRFYFLSSDDLLEILGQARDPQNVQAHLKKCFEGVKRLEMLPAGSDGRKQCESVGIYSPDGEYLPMQSAVVTEGQPEEWLNSVEAAMFATTKAHLYKVLEDSKAAKKEKWVKDNPGQMVITAGQIVWTAECEKALSDADGAKKALKLLKKKWVSYLNKLTAVTRSKLSAIDRNKVVALITIEVHARDVIEKLCKANCSSTNDFDWVSQLRFYWDRDVNDCVVKQVLSVFTYGYEYQGNNGRLVITPLTDRCYMTLGAAMYTRRGGNPLGPAGTGKTETVKDFGKALARYVIVFNCSDGVDYKMTGKMFSGLAQTGAWACLDEFNRIEVEVLSVVATQIACVMTAIKEGRSRFNFLGQDIRLIPSCAICVTMNPGYAGRSELPDNLKALLRPVSMMVPDFTLIAEILMFSEGFSSAKVLAKKMVAIMELSQQQLSKQDHYDYGLRSFVIPIARAAGSLKRLEPDAPEEVILYRTMLDLIKPKLVYLDLPLFMALLSDLFPGVELPPLDGGVLRAAIELDLRDNGLQPVPEFVTKIIQIHDCKVARHGNMIVGKTGSGKSEAWKCLQRTLGKLRAAHPEVDSFQRVHVYSINPLALSNDELYGSFEEATHEWRDGVLARIMRTACKDEASDQKWILFDGPVDTLWIESMNTTLDDNKLLTLLSGERIAMPAQVSLLFEVEDLSQASPATVSRAGMIYLNVEDLGWRPFITSWLAAKTAGAPPRTASAPSVDAAAAAGVGGGPSSALAQQVVGLLAKLLERYLDAALEYKRLHCRELVRIDRLSCVRTFARLFDALATPENGVNLEEGADVLAHMVEMWFLFSLIWGLGGSLDEEGRKKFDGFMREMDTRYPSAETVFEYHVDVKNRQWLAWDSKLSGSFKPRADIPAYRLLVPTVDTVRSTYLTGTLVRAHCHTLVVGGVGVGKTMTLQSMLEALPSNVWSSCTINFSAQTSSDSLQDTIEGKLEKRAKGVFVPAGGKRLIAFIDDLNMPKKSKFGFIPPLELLKLWVDNSFWYDRARCELKYVKDTQLLGAMAPPGGGRNHFSQRISACFSTINMTQPNDAQLKRIFSTLLNLKLCEFDDDVRPLAEPIVAASVEIYRAVSRELLPTPSKSHYLFNTRDLAKIVLGVMQASKSFYDNKEDMLQLWVHEMFRVVGDRMWDPVDVAWLRKQVDERLSSAFNTNFATLFESFKEEVPPFVHFLRPNMDVPPYEPVRDLAALKDTLSEKLEDYALEPGAKPLDLVLFKDALLHVCRIHRILSQPRGNALLVGVGGSGRKSLARLAAYIGELKVFSIEITNTYRLTEFREDLKGLYRQTGVAGKPTMFLFDESQIKYETFLEDVNNILTSGEVPNLFPKDELAALLDELRPAAKAAGAGETQEQLATFFLERVRANLHVVLCLSAVGEALRERCRLFPGLVNCTTIDWFTEWPADALYEVASRQMAAENLGNEEVKQAVCKMFVTAHQSVEATSLRMFQTLKRRNCVTPTSYLETVANYRALLSEKRAELSGKANKLKGGLTKLDETRTQVTEMKKVVQQKQVVVAQAKADCEELLVEIVQDKRVADEQEKQVHAEATKIAKETKDANVIAAQVAAELERALPALQEAEAALNVLTKKDISELKAYSKPPLLVDMTLSGVMTVLKRPGSWEEAKKALGDANFMSKLLNFDKDNMDDALLKKINKFTVNSDFTPDAVGKVSLAAKGMCMWVRAMEVYGTIAKDVGPKRARLKAAQDNVAKKQAALTAAQTQLEAVLAKVKVLRDRYEDSMGRKKVLEDELKDLEGKLQRAEKLVTGLAGERVRWESSITGYEGFLAALPGDALLAAAFLSYAGPFPSEYRDELVKGTWVPQMKQLGIPASDSFDFCGFLADPPTVRDWNIQGLPADAFSTANGVMVTRGRRWPLLVDPQCQAVRWIKNMEAHAGLRVMSITASDMVRQLESAVQFGQPVLLVDVLEEIDPVLEPLLAKAYVRRNNQLVVKIGEKEVDVSSEFRLYLTTKLPNPTYAPEISTKAMIINFAVKMTGLEAQLLDTVVKHERPDLATQKSALVVKVAAGRRTQLQLEDTVLRLLSTATGSLLDNIELINTLDQSKTTWEEVNESLKVAEETSRQIEVASAQYRPCSTRAAILYFVLNELAATDAMYQFSLDAYSSLFHLSLSDSPKPEALADRIKALNDYHTYAVYKYASRGLFEQHKLLLSLQMCSRILQASGQINAEEWQFFLQGGRVLDRSQQQPNPCPHWISEEAWDNLSSLEQLQAFKGLASSLDSAAADWELWFRQAEPEAAELPRDWEAKCNELQRLLLIRSLRPDRVIFAATTYVANAIGRQYVEPPVLDLAQALADSSPLTPLIFVLSPGVDPTDQLRKLAAEKGMADKLHTVALGQGQAPVAKRLMEEGIKRGHWVFLANCHLMTSWLPTLDKIVDGLEAAKPHKNFRLWLSSNPCAAFPISLLQAGLKMTTEPPKGLRANLLRLYNGVSEDSFRACKATGKYQKLLFALAYFHSVLLERRKFRTLGLNIPYDFNDTDFSVSDDLLKSYLDCYADTPWEALKYLIAEANYGGRVTDELDRRLLGSYLSSFYCEEALEVVNFKLSSLPQYFIPEPGSITSYKDYILTLPTTDRPEAFGQHPNAEISYLIEDSKALLGGMLSLAPRSGGSSGGSNGGSSSGSSSGGAGSSAAASGGSARQEELVEVLANDLLDQVPAPFNLEAVMKAKQDDPSALHVVLFQEIERYNTLLVSVRRSCAELVKGIKGLVVMSADLDQVFEALYAGKVPSAWLKAYPSLKGLGPWTRDLLARIEQLARWAEGTYPRIYWLGGFTYPTGFLTAVLQTTARRNGIPIDSLVFEYGIVNLEEREINGPPKEGVYVKGLFLEGAGWDFEGSCLCEPQPMELIVPMPIIHFRPVESKKKSSRGVYNCPLYLYPVRTGTRERPSYMGSVDLRAGAAEADHWIMRGTALLLSLSA